MGGKRTFRLAVQDQAQKLELPSGGGMSDSSTSTHNYREGQVWEYDARPGDEGSLLKIQKVEPYSGAVLDGRAYHISVVGVQLGKPGLEPVISHAPVSRETLDASVTRLSSSDVEFPSADEGINIWRSDEGGVFTVPMRAVVGYIDDVSQQPDSDQDEFTR
jgi:hypothetical protein